MPSVGSTSRIPTGGTAGQILRKNSAVAFDLRWDDPNVLKGDAATVTVGTTTTGNAGTNAAVTNSGTTSAAVLNFTVPRGAAGADGSAGAAATVAVGTTTTGNAGTNAAVTNSGSSSAAVLNFTVPRGADGSAGAAGPANSLSIGTVSTLAAGASATASVTGTAPSQTLNLGIPAGAAGASGSAVTVSAATITATTGTLTAGNMYHVDTSANGTCTLKLPALVPGAMVVVKKVSADGGNVFIQPASGESYLIDGWSQHIINRSNTSVTFIAVDTTRGWKALSSHRTVQFSLPGTAGQAAYWNSNMLLSGGSIGTTSIASGTTVWLPVFFDRDVRFGSAGIDITSAFTGSFVRIGLFACIDGDISMPGALLINGSNNQGSANSAGFSTSSAFSGGTVTAPAGWNYVAILPVGASLSLSACPVGTTPAWIGNGASRLPVPVTFLSKTGQAAFSGNPTALTQSTSAVPAVYFNVYG